MTKSRNLSYYHSLMISVKKYTVGHNGGIILFYPNLWNNFDNDLFLIDLDKSIHSHILLNNNLRVFALCDC